jgi:hypothetical protein
MRWTFQGRGIEPKDCLAGPQWKLIQEMMRSGFEMADNSA